MDERMTLEMVRNELRTAESAAAEGVAEEWYGRMADAIDAHLTQPSQAVDVRSAVVKAIGGYLERHWPDNPVSYDDMADHITRAIGNAQAEGWIKGFPAKHWADEWFIAVLKDGSRAVLRALPEEYSHDFKTADETYYTKEWVVKWMQFPDSQFIAPPTKATPNAHE